MENCEAMTSSTHSFAYSYRLVKKCFWKICETSKCHNFLIFQPIFVRFSLFCSNFFTLSSEIKLNLFWISSLIVTSVISVPPRDPMEEQLCPCWHSWMQCYNRVMTRVTYQDIPVTQAVFCDSLPLKFVHDSTDSTRTLKWDQMTRLDPKFKWLITTLAEWVILLHSLLYLLFFITVENFACILYIVCHFLLYILMHEFGK